jgi:hypothetical protein
MVVNNRESWETERGKRGSRRRRKKMRAVKNHLE